MNNISGACRNKGKYKFAMQILYCLIHILSNRITIHRDIWSGLKPFIVGTSIHFFATIFCIIEICLSILLSEKIMTIMETITGECPRSIALVIYISEASMIIGYSAYAFSHKNAKSENDFSERKQIVTSSAIFSIFWTIFRYQITQTKQGSFNILCYIYMP